MLSCRVAVNIFNPLFTDITNTCFFLYYSSCNLAQKCLKPDFSRQLRAHGLVNKTLMLLKDSLEHEVGNDTSAFKYFTSLVFLVTQGCYGHTYVRSDQREG